MSFENSAGLSVRNHYGPRKVNSTFGGSHISLDGVVTSRWRVDLAEVITGAPSTSNSIIDSSTVEGMEHIIPAYSKVLSCVVVPVSALATTGGSAAASAYFTVGLEEAATSSNSPGTAIDADGLMDATDGALTIASNDIAQARGAYLRGNAAALISNYQYDGDATGAPVDVTYVEAVSIGQYPAELVLDLTIDDVTGMTAISGTVEVVVSYMPDRA